MVRNSSAEMRISATQHGFRLSVFDNVNENVEPRCLSAPDSNSRNRTVHSSSQIVIANESHTGLQCITSQSGRDSFFGMWTKLE